MGLMTKNESTRDRLKELQKKYKRGWYQKGQHYRFLHSLNTMGFLIYQTKSKKLKNSSEMTGINPDFNNWFDKAVYIGLDLKQEESELNM